jgi:hypothetical protein
VQKILKNHCEILGSHGIEYEDDSLLGYCAVVALLMETINISETSVNFYETTQCNIPECCHLHKGSLMPTDKIMIRKHHKYELKFALLLS